jgi:hypothetical protein
MKTTPKPFKISAVALTAVALCLAVGSTTASAQTEHCANLYNRMMTTYQTGGSGSAQYTDQYARYNNECQAGAVGSRPYAYQQPYVGSVQAYLPQQSYAPYRGGWEQDRDRGNDRRRDWDQEQR